MSAAILVSCALAASACERRAPGPRECERVAIELIRGSRPPRPGFGAMPVREADVEAIALKCLTTPFDRKLVDCVVNTRSDPRVCITAFDDRRRRESASGW